MENVVLTVHLIIALLMIGVVLLQRSEGGGLLSGGGAFSARGAANALYANSIPRTRTPRRIAFAKVRQRRSVHT